MNYKKGDSTCVLSPFFSLTSSDNIIPITTAATLSESVLPEINY